MKIYILPVDKRFQPDFQVNKYPLHNNDFGVEQDFLEYLLANNDLLTDDCKKADWHYLPVFWTRWHVNHKYATNGLVELQEGCGKAILDSQRTFTICQYCDGPIVNIGNAKIFLSSRNNSQGLDIPLLSNSHKIPQVTLKKKYLASFVGNLEAHSIRIKMAELLKNRRDIYIFDSHRKRNFLMQKLIQFYVLVFFENRSKFFAKKMLQSYISLCPRGKGGGSFRFFESMQLGVMPFLIGDVDVRPFKEFIEWDKISFYAKDAEEAIKILNSVDKNKLVQIGQECKKVYEEKLAYKKWCELLIKQLEIYGK